MQRALGEAWLCIEDSGPLIITDGRVRLSQGCFNTRAFPECPITALGKAKASGAPQKGGTVLLLKVAVGSLASPSALEVSLS